MKVISKITFLLIAFSIAFASCKKDDEGSGTTDPPPNPASANYFAATIGGINVSYEAGTNNITSFTDASLNLATLPDTSTASYGASLGSYDAASGEITPVFEIKKGTLRFAPAPNPENAIFKDFFGVGIHPFSPFAESGFEVEWYDSSGVLWSTSLGTALQTGSFLEIETITEIEQYNNYYIRTKISFSCKLYDDAGNSKQLTDGKFLGEFENL